MGLGQHKTLDFLSLSLNLPVNYHPSFLHSHKFTKSLHNLMKAKEHILNFNKKEES